MRQLQGPIRKPQSTARLALHGMSLGAIFAFADALAAHRSYAWVGFSPLDWVAVGATFMIYTTVGAATIALSFEVLSLILGGQFEVVLAPVAVFLSGILVWSILCACHAPIFIGNQVGVVALLLGAALVAAFAPRTMVAPGIWTIACGAGIAVMSPVTRVFFLYGDRATITTVAAVGAALLTALAAIAVLKYSRFRPVVILVWLLMLAVPFSVEYARDHRALSPGGESAPNLLLITCDALRADYCSAYQGQVPTPELKRLASEGAEFLHSYSLAPWTLPSLDGMLSSSYPPSLSPGASEARWETEMGRYWFPPGKQTFAELLRAHGYRTAAFSGNPLIRNRHLILRGFENTRTYDHCVVERRGFFRRMPMLSEVLARLDPAFAPLHALDTTALIKCDGQAFLRQNSSQPFFLWLHFMDPHSPYDPPARFRTLSGPWPVFEPGVATWHSPQNNKHGDADVPVKFRPYVRSLYDGEIRYVDEAIARVIDTLSNTTRRHTYVCVTADHGEELWDHGRNGHGFSLYNELLHVPLIIIGPGIQPKTVTTAISSVDLLPTLADLLGVQANPMWRGTSWAGLLERGKPPEHPTPIFAQATNYYCRPEPLQAAIAWPYELIRGMASGHTLLFDLNHDPHEQTDLASRKPEIVGRLTNALAAWSRTFPTTFTQLDNAVTHSESNAELRRRLRSMGYLQ